MRGVRSAFAAMFVLALTACATGPQKFITTPIATVMPAELEGLSPEAVLAKLGVRSADLFVLSEIALIDGAVGISKRFRLDASETQCPPPNGRGAAGRFGVRGPAWYFTFIDGKYSLVSISPARTNGARAGEPFVTSCAYALPRGVGLPNPMQVTEIVVMSPAIALGATLAAGEVAMTPVHEAEWRRRAQILATLRLGQPLPGGTDAFLKSQARGTIEGDVVQAGKRIITYALADNNRPTNRAYLTLENDVVTAIAVPPKANGGSCELGPGPSVLC